MAVRARAFCTAHPSVDESFVKVLGRLDETIGRMEELAGQQVGGFLSKHSSTVQRKELRRRVHDGLLPHLLSVATQAAEEKPALTEMFELPALNATHKVFGTVARKMLEQGKAEKEILLKHGLSEKLLDDLSAAMDEFDASIVQTSNGLQDHVLARAELDLLSDEVVSLVGVLDGINRYRFDDEPQLMEAWRSAKHVVTGPQSEKEENPVTPPGGKAA
jgi:hypothetical protein